MDNGFIDFCAKLFPSIDPYTKEQAKLAMNQFNDYSKNQLTTIFDCDELDQGDIFSEIPFTFVDDDGEIRCIKQKAQLLSNSCDASRDERLIFAAIHKIDGFEYDESTVDAIKKNRKYNCFYIPDSNLNEEYIDFELLTSYSREAFNKMILSKKVNKICSLNQVGYFMFICKLTIFFMRREDDEVYASRSDNGAYE